MDELNGRVCPTQWNEGGSVDRSFQLVALPNKYKSFKGELYCNAIGHMMYIQ